MIFHVMDQRALKEGEGPIALICAPTRELAQQIEKECKRFGNFPCVRVRVGSWVHAPVRAPVFFVCLCLCLFVFFSLSEIHFL